MLLIIGIKPNAFLAIIQQKNADSELYLTLSTAV